MVPLSSTFFELLSLSRLAHVALRRTAFLFLRAKVGKGTRSLGSGVIQEGVCVKSSVPGAASIYSPVHSLEIQLAVKGGFFAPPNVPRTIRSAVGSAPLQGRCPRTLRPPRRGARCCSSPRLPSSPSSPLPPPPGRHRPRFACGVDPSGRESCHPAWGRHLTPEFGRLHRCSSTSPWTAPRRGGWWSRSSATWPSGRSGSSTSPARNKARAWAHGAAKALAR